MNRHKNRVGTKLKSRRGETLVETLCAIVVLALSASMLSLMTSAAAKITRDAALASAVLSQQVSVAEQRAGTQTAELAIAFKDGETVEITDALLTGSLDKLYSFALPEKEDEES